MAVGGTKMSEKKTIAVVGATGAQGGGLARAILGDPDSPFEVRALTRKPDSDPARQLAELGAQVVQADLDDAASVREAFDGAYGAFCVTNFWEHFSPEREQAQARHMAQGAAEEGLEHVIWSTLEDVRRFVPLSDPSIPTLNGMYKVPHFDGKGAIDHVFTDLGVPTTFLLTSFYWENLIYFGMGPSKSDGGGLLLTFPMGNKKLAGIAVADIGKCAYGIFRRGAEMMGKTVGVAGDHLDGETMASELSRAMDQEVRYQPMSVDAYRKLGFPGADDLGNMFQFYCDFEAAVCQSRSLAASRALNPELQSFTGWLAQNGSRIPAL
jgi:uncharacterized protein YbjT (DUF2867 family)